MAATAFTSAINASSSAVWAPRLRGVVFGGYRDYVDVNREIWAELFRTVVRARAGAVVIHCSAGQDRTGFASALLLLALGVPRDVVLADYMLTNVYRPGETAVEDIEESPVPRSPCWMFTSSSRRSCFRREQAAIWPRFWRILLI